MLFRELEQVNTIDGKIQALHQELGELYSQRAQLLDDAPVASANALSATQTMYNQLAAAWAPYPISFPTFRSLEKKLRKAEAALHDAHWHTAPAIVAVPPFGQLQKILKTTDSLRFADSALLKSARKSSTWSIILLDDPQVVTEDSLPETSYADLGIQALVAAELQGYNTAQHSGWTLLLKDMSKDGQVPCVSATNEQLLFDVDDSHCLIGENYIIPALQIA